MNAAVAEILLSAIACVTFLMAVRSGVTTAAEKKVRPQKAEVRESGRFPKRVLAHRPVEEKVDVVSHQMASGI